MTPKEKNLLKLELQAEIDDLEAQIERLKENTQPVEPDVALGRLTRLDEMSAKSVHMAARRNAEDKLRKVKFKLMTIGTPLYEA